jgi:hypothetical protein
MELRTFPTYVRAYILDSLKAMGLDDCTRTDNTVVLTMEGYFIFCDASIYTHGCGLEILPTNLPGSFTVKVGSIFTNIEIYGSAFTYQIRLERTYKRARLWFWLVGTLSIALLGIITAPVRAFVRITLSVALGNVVVAPVRAFVRIASRGRMTTLSLALGSVVVALVRAFFVRITSRGRMTSLSVDL